MENQYTLVNFEGAQQAILRAIKLRGVDHMYRNPGGSGCVNIHLIKDDDGTVVARELGCIVGTAAVLAGWHTVNSCPVEGTAGLLTKEAKKNGFLFTAKASAYLGSIQYLQDRNRSWGNAHDEALAEVARDYDLLPDGIPVSEHYCCAGCEAEQVADGHEDNDEM